MKIILASKSPRRCELLKKLGYDFLVVASGREEIFSPNLEPLENCQKVSLNKALDVMEKTEGDRIIISSDTIVLKGNVIYGKPKNRIDAYNMLKSLSGKTHEVITALTVLKIINNKVEKIEDYSKTLITIDVLSTNEINNYLDTNEPYDKAGAYAIQGLFSKHIVKIEGDYYATVGLPINKLYNILKKIDL